MAVIRPQDADQFVRKPRPSQPYILVYGPDEGLVRERINQLILAVGADSHDPFTFCRLSADVLRDFPARLLEEASSLSLIGGHRTIVAELDPRFPVATLNQLMSLDGGTSWVICHARDLKRDHPQRLAFEKAMNAAAIACYPDTERDLRAVILQELNSRDTAIDEDALELLISLLGADRTVTRNELAKLFLYCDGLDRIRLADVTAIISDAYSLSLDDVVDYACTGNTRAVVEYFSNLNGQNIAIPAILPATLRWLGTLHQASMRIENGASLMATLEGWRPPLHFRRKPAIKSSLELWSSRRLLTAISAIDSALLESRKMFRLSGEITERSLLQISQLARQKD